MAEEAECLDFYNYVYTPFSSCVHSTWNHISRFNLIMCQNPLHQYHRTPVSTDPPVEIFYLDLAGRYLDKAERTFDLGFSLDIDQPSAYSLLSEDLAAFTNEMGDDDPTDVP
jgi:hypothetical protein